MSDFLYQKPPLGVSLDLSNPINRDLVGFWLFNEAGGIKAYDLSGNNYHGTLTNIANPPTATSGWNPGKTGIGLRFDGTDDYVDIPYSFVQSNVVTFEIWFNTQNASWDILFGVENAKLPADPNSYDSIFAIKDTGVLRAELYTGTLGEISTSFSVRDGRWHQAILTGNINIQSLYVDGNFIGSRSGTLQMDGQGTLTFLGTGYDITSRGFPSNSWHYFNGFIDNACVYNQALSAQEIFQLYLAPYAGLSDASLAYNKIGETTTLFIQQIMQHKFIPPFLGVL